MRMHVVMVYCTLHALSVRARPAHIYLGESGRGIMVQASVSTARLQWGHWHSLNAALWTKERGSEADEAERPVPRRTPACVLLTSSYPLVQPASCDNSARVVSWVYTHTHTHIHAQTLLF